MQAVTKNILKFTATGLLAGVALGWLLSLPSGNDKKAPNNNSSEDVAKNATHDVTSPPETLRLWLLRSPTTLRLVILEVVGLLAKPETTRVLQP